MYNNTEISAVELSPTKKDFYQIWNELMDITHKLSDRWDPVTTNESDPGIVLLKVLTAIADKLNYIVDANTLEAFMPSAAQESSMRKLCEMLGYNMRYFRSATTTTRITFNGTFPASTPNIVIDQFTNLKNVDGSVNYLTLEPVVLSDTIRSVTVPCIEGELVECVTDNENIIALSNLDDNNRYYLPETQIASNGIFITNVITDTSGVTQSTEFWKQTDNLNTLLLGTKAYKFSYDSSVGLPYVQFPSDISTLIQNGLHISFIRTHGIDGNIKLNKLSVMEKPKSWEKLQQAAAEETEGADVDLSYLEVENYTVSNIVAASNGANPETIDEAYWNYQKTIGTFDTLVTCRDYMNKIYQMTISEVDSTPLVSNILVTDIRTDINRAYNLCTINQNGVDYESKVIKSNGLDRIDHFDLVLYPFKTVYGLNKSNEFKDSFTYPTANNQKWEIEAGLEENKTISHVYKYPDLRDIVCIKNYYLLDAKISTTYKVSAAEALEIEQEVHAALYKNFNMRHVDFGKELPLDAVLSAMEKADSRIKSVGLMDPKLRTAVLYADGSEVFILDETGQKEVDTELYTKLVLRNVLAGRLALLNYDTNFISSLAEAPYPTSMDTSVTGTEELDLNTFDNPADVTLEVEYEPFFIPGGDRKSYQVEAKVGNVEGGTPDDRETCLVQVTAPEGEHFETPKITSIESSFEIKLNKLPVDSTTTEKKVNLDLDLGPKEVISFRAPSLKTVKTFPAYVNYYLEKKPTTGSSAAAGATMQTLQEFFNGGPGRTNFAYESFPDATAPWDYETSWESKFNSLPAECIGTVVFSEEERGVTDATGKTHILTTSTELTNTANNFRNEHLELFTKNGDTYEIVKKGDSYNLDSEYYYFNLTSDNFSVFLDWLSGKSINGKKITYWYHPSEKRSTNTTQLINNVYTRSYAASYYQGYLVDASKYKYTELTALTQKLTTNSKYFKELYVPVLWGANTDSHTSNGLGRDAIPTTIKANTEYALRAGEALYINYTTSEGQAEGKTAIVNLYYGPGTIIRPNFDIEDSSEKSALRGFDKLSGFGPEFVSQVKGQAAEVPNLPGMYTFGVQEQVEIRERVEVTLDGSDTCLYWTLQPEREVVSTDGKIYFPFVETPEYYTYTLQAGEYIYYTNSARQSLAYYGAGTEVRAGLGNKRAIFKKESENGWTADQIAEQGLAAGIPWRNYNLSSEGKNIKLIEYQYQNLTEGDTVKSISFENSMPSKLDFSFVPVKTADFICQSTEGSLPSIEVEGITWEVQSRLELSISAVAPQVLKAQTKVSHEDSSKTILITRPLVRLYTLKPATGEEIVCQVYAPLFDSVTGQSTELILASNSLINSPGGKFSLGGEKDISFKVYKPEVFSTSGGELISVGTGPDGLTEFTFSDDHYSEVTDDDNPSGATEEQIAKLVISTLVPDNYFGILSIYKYHLDITSTTDRLEIQLESLEGDETPSPELFNANAAAVEGSWWKDYKDGNRYYLRDGLNVIKVPKSCRISLLHRKGRADKNLNDILYLSNFSLVQSGNELNPKLGLENTEANYFAVLDYIKDLDSTNEFFYNVPISTTVGLDLNYLDQTDTLLNPKNWFDSRNVNNNFIISEIDADHLTNHVTISRFSRSS